MADVVSHLRCGAVLNGNFKIEKVLGQGGFGITYLATDLALQRPVAIKEFFPREFCNRDSDTSHVSVGTVGNKELVERFKAKFLKEARNIARFDCPYIIKIYAAFEANGTAYYVMEYIEGENLSQIVKGEGPLPEGRALGYIEKVGEALEYIHDKHKMNHLDVKPANIMVRRSTDTPILIDFGLSKQYAGTGHQTSTTPVGISHGYAPLEQYSEGGVSEFSPASDVYSLAATLYCLLTGNTPPSAPTLQEEDLIFPGSVSPSVRSAILKAMESARKRRHQSVREFLSHISRKIRNADDTMAIPPTRGSQNNSEETLLKRDNVIDTPAAPLPPAVGKGRALYRNPWFIFGTMAMVVGLVVALVIAGTRVKKSGERETVWMDDTVAAGKDAITTDVGPAQETEPESEHEVASAENLISQAPATAVYGGHTSVNLGLSVNWADCNLGASSPSDYGEYFVWGITSPGFQYDYCSSASSICGNPRYDAATANWGNGWRMPSSAECKELLDRCKWLWTSRNGVKGYEVTGPNGNSIFLPAAGYIKDGSLEYFGTNGNYWSGTPSGEYKASYISYQKTDYRERRVLEKDRARSIRPVRNK